MFSLFPTNGHSTREHRLCGLDNQPREIGQGSVFDSINRFTDGVVTRVQRFLDPLPAQHAESERRMRDPGQWIEAFRQTDIFAAPFEPITTNTVLNPRTWLLSLQQPEQRAAEFYKFIRCLVPEHVRQAEDEFDHPLFRVADVDAELAANPASATIPTPADVARLLDVAAAVLGREPNVPAGSLAQRVAREYFADIFPPGQIGPLYKSYQEALQMLRVRNPQRPIPPAQLRERGTLLLELGRLNPPPRFLAWLRVEDPVRAQAALNAVAEQNEKASQHKSLVELSINLEAEQLNAKMIKEAQQNGKTISQNIESFYENNPKLAMGFAILALWGGWKMLTTDKKLLGFIPWKTFPILALGTYAYLRVIKGDENALDTMLSNAKRFTDSMGSGISSVFNRGLLPPTVAQQDRQRIQQLLTFFQNEGMMERAGEIAPLLTVASVKSRHLAGNAFNFEADGNGNFNAYLFAPQGSAMQIEVDNVIRARGYDRNRVYGAFADPIRNRNITFAMAGVYARLASRDVRYRHIATEVEQSMSGQVSDSGFISFNPEALPTADLKQKYALLVNMGRNIAITQYPDKPLYELVDLLVTPPTVDRLDTAEGAEAPGRGANQTREAERALYAERERPLETNRNLSIQRIEADFQEFTAFWSSGNRPMLAPDAVKRLNEYVHNRLQSGEPLAKLLEMSEKLKYALLVAAATRISGGPLTAADIQDSLVPEDRPIADFFTNIGNWINQRFTVSSHLQDINNLANVEAIVQQRPFTSGIESTGGLPLLLKQITSHRARFALLRDSNRLTQQFIESLPPDTINRFGAPPPAARAILQALILRLAGSPAFQQMINQGEQYYAQRVTNDLVTAQLTTHRRTGDHVLDANPADRWISPIEERNLVTNNEFLLTSILGPAGQPLRGMWAAMAMRQVFEGFRPEALDAANDAQRTEAVSQLQQIMGLHVALEPVTATPAAPSVFPGPLGPIVLPALSPDLRQRVRVMAQRYLAEWNFNQARIAGLQKLQQDLQKQMAVAGAQSIVPGLQPPLMAAVQLNVLQKLQEEAKKTDEELQKERKAQINIRSDLTASESYRTGIHTLVYAMALLDMTRPADHAELRQMLQLTREYLTTSSPTQASNEHGLLITAQTLGRNTFGVGDVQVQQLQKVPVVPPAAGAPNFTGLIPGLNNL